MYTRHLQRQQQHGRERLVRVADAARNERVHLELEFAQPQLLQTSAYVSIRQHVSAYVSIRQHAVSIRQHTLAYVSIRQHAVSIRQHASAHSVEGTQKISECGDAESIFRAHLPPKWHYL